MRFARAELPEKESEAANSKSNADQAESRANPGKEGSFGCEVNPWVLLCTFKQD